MPLCSASVSICSKVHPPQSTASLWNAYLYRCIKKQVTVHSVGDGKKEREGEKRGSKGKSEREGKGERERRGQRERPFAKGTNLKSGKVG